MRPPLIRRIGERLALATGWATQRGQAALYGLVEFIHGVREPFDPAHDDGPHITDLRHIGHIAPWECDYFAAGATKARPPQRASTFTLLDHLPLQPQRDYRFRLLRDADIEGGARGIERIEAAEYLYQIAVFVEDIDAV